MHKTVEMLEGTERNLSKVGKEILLKSVFQAIPIYPVSMFELLVNLCTKIEIMVAQYLWSNKNDGGGIHLVA